jgi:hypothetical protein
MRRVAEAALALSASPAGFTASELAQQVRSMSGHPESEYGARRAAYDIKKLRGKAIVHKIGNSRRYESIPQGLQALAALLLLREKIIRPLLAASSRPQPPSQPAHPKPITTTKAFALVCVFSSLNSVWLLELRQFIPHLLL